MVDQSTAQLSATMQSMLTGAATVNISAQLPVQSVEY
jgi:hypothetical protein